MIIIRPYVKTDELNWLDLHASVMVDSSAWWIVEHKKPVYRSPKVVDLVAQAGEQLVGFITVEVESEIMNGDPDCGFVWEFGVHRNWRGQGIGRRLLEEAHRELKRRFAVTRTIWYSQEPNSQRWYEKMGMWEIGRHWQFSVFPTAEQNLQFKQDGFVCERIRGSCKPEDFARVRQKYNIVEDIDALKPRTCIGYEYDWTGDD